MITKNKVVLLAYLLLAFTAACATSSDDDASDASNSNPDGSMAMAGRGGAGSAGHAGSVGNAGSGGNAGRSGSDAADGGDAAIPGNDGGGIGAPVELATAADFAILAKSGISTVPGSNITGDIGVSPVAATYITGFSLIADATNAFATSTQVHGKVYAADYHPPTPAKMTAAVGDMALAFTDAAGRAPDVTELGAGNIGGMTLEPGVYKWSTGLLIPTDVTLSGSANDVWIFQIAQNLTISNGKKIVMQGGALPKNVFWQVSGKVSIGTTAHVEGIVLSQTAITLGTGASINGRLLAQKAVVIDSSTVVQPAD